MREVLYISLGAVVGANARYFLNRIVENVIGKSFPWGILIINVLGSGMVGFFAIWAATQVVDDPRWRLLVVIGFAGAFTTFSTYAFDSVQYLNSGLWSHFAANFLLNNLLCFFAVMAGMALAKVV